MRRFILVLLLSCAVVAAPGGELAPVHRRELQALLGEHPGSTVRAMDHPGFLQSLTLGKAVADIIIVARQLERELLHQVMHLATCPVIVVS